MGRNEGAPEEEGDEPITISLPNNEVIYIFID
jgi:hypothetical protein